jgi:hypothetical protein
MLLISIANHRKQTLGLCHAVNRPIGIKNLMPAMLRVCLLNAGLFIILIGQ